MSSSTLPGVTLDPKAEGELEEAFGVTSNAEELVRSNQARFTPAQREAMSQRVDTALTSTLYQGDRKIQLDENGQIHWSPDADDREFKSELTDAIGHPIEDAVVRGRGRKAVISYVYVGPRGSYEKDVIPYVDVFGTKAQKDKAAAERTPEQAAESVLSEAEAEARKLAEEAEAEVRELAADAREEAAKIIKEAEEEAQRIREKAQADAPKAAAKAEESESGKPAKAKAAKGK